MASCNSSAVGGGNVVVWVLVLVLVLVRFGATASSA